MALQIRRGVDGSGTGGRLTIIPAQGELLYTTDTKLVYVGDGETAGGNPVDSGITSLSQDTSPQLGGNLDVNGYEITAASGDITLLPTTGKIRLRGIITASNAIVIAPTTTDNVNLPAITTIGTATEDGNLTISRNNYSTATGAGLVFEQFHSNSNATPMLFYRARGSAGAEEAVQTLDRLGTIAFAGWDGTGSRLAAGITVATGATPTAGHVPGKFVISTDNGTVFAPRLQISNLGVVQFNQFGVLSGSSVLLNNTLATTATPATFWNYDSSGSTLTLTLGQTVNFASFSGSVLVNCYASGCVTQYLCGGGAGSVVSLGASKGTDTGTMAYNSGIGGYTFTSTEAGVHSFYVIRTRTGA